MTRCDVSRCTAEAVRFYDGLPFCQKHLTHCTCGAELVGTEEFGFACAKCSPDVAPFLAAEEDYRERDASRPDRPGATAGDCLPSRSLLALHPPGAAPTDPGPSSSNAQKCASPVLGSIPSHVPPAWAPAGKSGTELISPRAAYSPSPSAGDAGCPQPPLS